MKGKHLYVRPYDGGYEKANSSDNITKLLRDKCIDLGTEGEEVFYRKNNFLWNDPKRNCLFKIQTFKSLNYSNKHTYTRNISVESMPPAKLPRDLEDLLDEKGFIKSDKVSA